jgi:uncharacterized protein YbaR (Trm112 family)
MMPEYLLTLLRCPLCRASLKRADLGEGVDAVVICDGCRAWYPIEGDVLELLPLPLAYADDRARFWKRHVDDLRLLGLDPPSTAADVSPAMHAQHVQQTHFDWYARNDRQTYAAYERTPFWQA